MTTQEILKELEFCTGKFPRQALREAMADPGQMVPEFLRILKEAGGNIQKLVKQQGYMAHIYAMYLLAQFREREAYSLLIDFFSIPGNDPLEVTGDLVTEDLCRILAAVAGNDMGRIKALITNREADEYVRGAALDALVVLAAINEIPRDEVMQYFLTLFRGGLEREPSQVWNALVSCCCNLYPEEAMEEIEKVYLDDLAEEGFIDLDWVDRCQALGKETALAKLKSDPRNQLIEDTIREMEWWHCFNEPPKRRPLEDKALPDRHAMQAQSKKVGRNEPCSCGSGKKYKKCCGR